MIFGLTNALVNFQGYTNKIFAKKFNIFIIAYLNNILIYTNNNGDSYIAVIYLI